MFNLFQSKAKVSPNIQQKNKSNSAVPDMMTLVFEEKDIATALQKISVDIRLIIGFVSPELNFESVATKLKNTLPSDVKLILSTTAGELCSYDGAKPLPNLYSQANAGSGNNIVLMLFSKEMVSDVFVASIPLKSEDIGTNSKTAEQRSALIAQEIQKIHVPFKMNYEDTLGYTLIDGLSSSESFFMQAVYDVGDFPCLLVGGSAGGKLDFQETYIFDGTRSLRHHAIITFIKLAPRYRFGIFKSQNFKATQTKFTVLAADPILRTVSAFLDTKTNIGVSAIEALSTHFKCQASELHAKLANYTFGIEIGKEIYIRSVASINTDTDTIHFYCDLEPGEELILLEKTSFVETTNRDFSEFSRKKPKAIGAIFNDCILRRLSNTQELNRLQTFKEIPVAGFSTFGELLGVNINQTLTAIFFYKLEQDSFEDDYIDHFVQKYAGFKSYFLQRTINRQSIINNINKEMLAQMKESMPVIQTVGDAIQEAVQSI